MSRPNSPSPDVERSARQAASNPWVERLARFGYAAKGVVYFIVGLLAAQAAFGTGGQTTDTQGALTTIVNAPFGKFLLVLVAIGLVGYALWRIVEAVFDPEHPGEDNDAKNIARRIGYGFSAIAYGGLAFTAIQLIRGTGGGSGGDSSTQDWTARLMSQPFGQWLVGLGGLIAIGVGLSFLYQAFTAKFQRHFCLHQMSHTQQKAFKWIGRFGMASRGVVFGIIGIFLIVAAWQSDPQEARGLAGALSTLAQQPFGPWLLGIVALGLIAYSIYCLIAARYRRINQPT